MYGVHNILRETIYNNVVVQKTYGSEKFQNTHIKFLSVAYKDISSESSVCYRKQIDMKLICLQLSESIHEGDTNTRWPSNSHSSQTLGCQCKPTPSTVRVIVTGISCIVLELKPSPLCAATWLEIINDTGTAVELIVRNKE